MLNTQHQFDGAALKRNGFESCNIVLLMSINNRQNCSITVPDTDINEGNSTGMPVAA
jgi:hypothetical protein